MAFCHETSVGLRLVRATPAQHAGTGTLAAPGTFQHSVSIMNDLGKVLVVVGLVIVALGLLLWSGVGKIWLGRLPGDIHYTRDNVSFHFPIVTCLLISLALTVLLWLFRK